MAPDYSKIIKHPMCFIQMGEKIHSGQYLSWLAFVEDFELICYNAMKYNRKRSKIWNLANSMLCRGKRILRHFSGSEFMLSLGKGGTLCSDQENARSELNENLVEFDENVPRSQAQQVCASVNCILPLSGMETEDQMVVVEKSQVTLRDGWDQNVIYSPAESLGAADETVEILKPLADEGFRVTIDDQATECSSSFSSTHSEWDDEICEVESKWWDGNGATTAAKDVSVTSKRRKRALDDNWKRYRSGIEWRCRWLELRIQRLQSVANKHAKFLETIESCKWKCSQELSSARTSDLSMSFQQCHVLRRRKRRKAEESLDCMSQMSIHPVFSRYEKQKHCNQELSREKGLPDDVQQKLEFDEFGLDFGDELENNLVCEEDSFEHYLWQIERLQMQVLKLEDQLTSHSVIPENLTKEVSGLEIGSLASPPTCQHSPHGLTGRSSVRELKAHGGMLSRRRNSDFDINDFIMPGSVMMNFVEPVRYEFIETPRWRLKSESAVEFEEESSEEDTDDEVYLAQHEQMQAIERQQQYGPLPLNKSRNLSTAKQNPKTGKIEKGIVSNAMFAGDFQENQLVLPASLGYIPKRKRRGRQSKKIAVSKVI
ncbi:hypothetical protein KP509_23G018800 [Ceratopteris richardii]|nr:hypothetical protein KP509_23G018800 [Ceratopteris richardii]